MDLYLAMAAPDLVVVVHVHKSTEASIFDDLQKLFLKEITISAIFTTYFSSTFSACCHSQGIIETAEYLEPARSYFEMQTAAANFTNTNL